jgi:hypothetical protein
MRSGASSSRRVELLYEIYEELEAQNEEEEFTSAELLQAADWLLKLSLEETVAVRHSDPGSHPNYFSHAVDVAMRNFPFTIWCNESRLQHETTQATDDLIGKLLSEHDEMRGV